MPIAAAGPSLAHSGHLAWRRPPVRRMALVSLVGLPAGVLLAAASSGAPAPGVWTPRAPSPTRRTEVAAAPVEGRIYLVGGFDRGGTVGTNEEYDPAADRWRSLPPMPAGRHGLGAVAVGGRVYVASGGPTPGFSFSDLNEVLALDAR